MRKGKIAAQCAHASMKVFLDIARVEQDFTPAGPTSGAFWMHIPINEIMKQWVEGLFTKVCVSVDSEEELEAIYNEAKASLPCAMVVDSGLTEFHGVSTKTVVAIGPAKSEKIDKITGDLKLL